MLVGRDFGGRGARVAGQWALRSTPCAVEATTVAVVKAHTRMQMRRPVVDAASRMVSLETEEDPQPVPALW